MSLFKINESNNKLIISKDKTILSALKQMDNLKCKLLIVMENDKFISVLSIGDIQRAIISKKPLGTPIAKILRDVITVAYEDEPFESIKNKMLLHRTECMPIINKNNALVKIYFWEDVFGKGKKRKDISLGLPVVIMAGGKGSRLKPITNVLPKPLIPIGEKTIIEEIMNRFVDVGCNQFYLSVNYKAEMIKHYFETLKNSDYNLEYIQENKMLGTAGSICLLKDKINSTFFVSNCDVLINQDLDEIYNYHKKNKNYITIVSALKHYKIPYGTIETKESGLLKSLNEKPELTFQINCGLYILEPHLLGMIPEDTFFHITELIEKVKQNKGRVGVFPINEGAWKDIGEWSEYFNNAKVDIK